MTDVSRCLLGIVGIGGINAIYYLIRTLWAQFMAGKSSWKESAPIRLALAMVLLVLALIIFILSAVISPATQPTGTGTYLVWGAWATCWVAEMVALSALGRVSPAILLSVLWVVGVLAARGLV